MIMTIYFHDNLQLINPAKFDQLTDFGLSKIGLMNCTTELSAQDTEKNNALDANDQLNADIVDSQQSAVGTPDYLAPEILLGTEHG